MLSKSATEKDEPDYFPYTLRYAAKEVLRKSDYMVYMHKTYGHLHFFTKETALITLIDSGYEIDDYFYTDELELEDNPKWIKPKLAYGIKKMMFGLNPGFTALLFNGYNLLVLAQGDRKKE